MSNVKSEDELIEEVTLVDSKLLAAQVVVYRGLGINKKLATACMEELVVRRKNGDDFEFEDFIDEEVAKIPKLKNMNLIDVTKGIQQQVRSLNVNTTNKTNNPKNSR